jgi:hypothetical protein
MLALNNPRPAIARTALKHHEAAFVLRTSEHDVALAVRRGDLGSVRAGRARRADPLAVEAVLAERGDALGLAFLRRIVSGGLRRVPRAHDRRTTAPSMTSHLESL